MEQTRMLTRELGVVGLINVQFAIYEGEIYILEVNPRASRTIPFVSKAIGVPLAKLAARVMAGKKLAESRIHRRAHAGPRRGQRIGLPVRAVPGRRHDPRPRDEIDRRSNGNRRIVRDAAFAKAELAASTDLPAKGCVVFLSVRDEDKPLLEPIVRGLSMRGFELVATGGTARYIERLGIPCAIGEQGRARLVRTWSI